MFVKVQKVDGVVIVDSPELVFLFVEDGVVADVKASQVFLHFQVEFQLLLVVIARHVQQLFQETRQIVVDFV